MKFGIRLLLAALSLLVPGWRLAADPVHLLCNHLANPLGIDSPKPRFSWQSDNPESNWRQSAYQLLVSTSAPNAGTAAGNIWDSGKVPSASSVGIPYQGPPLKSRTRYYWTVKVWNGKNHASKPVTSWWEMGLLNGWQASWITRVNPEEASDRAAMKWLSIPGQPVQNVPSGVSSSFRKRFKLDTLPKSAALFVICRGDFVATVNGHEVSSKADWSDFDRKDVTKELLIGDNTIELKLTSRESSPFGPRPKYRPTVIAALLKMKAPDGSIGRMGTDADWQGNVAGDLTDEALLVPGSLPQPAAIFQKDFSSAQAVSSARLYVTALGSYRATINGKPVTDGVLTPDFTDYRKRVEYQTYDVTALLTRGQNSVSITLGDGWFGSPLTWNATHLYPPPNRLLAQLEITYSDGTTSTVATGSDWQTAASPIVFSQIYAGEDYDARDVLQTPHWQPAAIADKPAAQLSGLVTSPVHLNAELKPVNIKTLPDNRYVFDFGQNMVGWVRLQAKGPAGTRVRMRFAEILNPDGSIYRQNLRNADATDTYTLSGAAEGETYEPTFTFHGFRYVEVSGYPGTPTLEALTGKVLGSLDEPNTGTLLTSSDLVNKMWKIGLWGQRGNFFSIPTDCPQRDERLGWMGDAGVFWRTGSYNFDIAAFTRKFMLDVTDAQTPKGDFTNVSPDSLYSDIGSEGAPGWSDAGVIVPYTAWLQYGDTSYIEDNWEAMQKFMAYIPADNPDFIRRKGNGPNFADWLAPDPNSPNELVATAYWALSARMMMEMAHAAGHESEAAQYASLIENIRAAYAKAFIKDTGEVAGATQTAYLLTLYAHLAPPALEENILNRLIASIHAHGDHLTTGFLGTPFLLFTLSEHSRSDIAYKLLLSETYPSWGYMLSKGATTWWERWNGDSGDPAMNSFNHYAFGSVVAWIYRSVAGIDTAVDGAGFQHTVIHPRFDGPLTKVHGEYDSAYGKITTDWSKNSSGKVTLKVHIPANTNATVHLPDEVKEVGSGDHSFTVTSAAAGRN